MLHLSVFEVQEESKLQVKDKLIYLLLFSQIVSFISDQLLRFLVFNRHDVQIFFFLIKVIAHEAGFVRADSINSFNPFHVR